MWTGPPCRVDKVGSLNCALTGAIFLPMFEVAGNEEIPTLEADAFLLETGNIRSEEASSELSGSVDNDDLEDDVS